ncbi:MAG TPA: hypothetical protein VK425_12400 [Acidimicrobiales bacterium]|nr:hypothetical protein [Acidimicrobiales bacterium]
MRSDKIMAEPNPRLRSRASIAAGFVATWVPTTTGASYGAAADEAGGDEGAGDEAAGDEEKLIGFGPAAGRLRRR